MAWVRFKCYEGDITDSDAEVEKCGRGSGWLSGDVEGVWYCGA